MSTSIIIEKVDLIDEDRELEEIMNWIERFKEKKLKGASLPTGWNLLQGHLDVTCCLCSKKGLYSSKCKKAKYESLVAEWDDDDDEEVLMDESLNVLVNNKEEEEVKDEKPQDEGNSCLMVNDDKEVCFLSPS